MEPGKPARRLTAAWGLLLAIAGLACSTPSQEQRPAALGEW
ncbi:hypothetical protein [Leptolyngbya sp. O-77]|nr:hypothetical protein [Leptolyngbya sp. O-77]